MPVLYSVYIEGHNNSSYPTQVPNTIIVLLYIENIIPTHFKGCHCEKKLENVACVQLSIPVRTTQHFSTLRKYIKCRINVFSVSRNYVESGINVFNYKFGQLPSGYNYFTDRANHATKTLELFSIYISKLFEFDSEIYRSRFVLSSDACRMLRWMTQTETLTILNIIRKPSSIIVYIYLEG